MGWLVDKLRSGRISLTVKELKTDLGSADDSRRAKILLKAQIARGEVIESSGVPQDLLDNSDKYPRELVMNIIGQLEDVIITGEHQLKAAVSQMKSSGIDG